MQECHDSRQGGFGAIEAYLLMQGMMVENEVLELKMFSL